jgi:hypothetical protein
MYDSSSVLCSLPSILHHPLPVVNIAEDKCLCWKHVLSSKRTIINYNCSCCWIMNGMEEKSGSGDWRDEKPSLIQSQRHVLETGLYSDVVVKVGGTKVEFIPCHRFVLMSRSGVFAAMLEERWRNCSESMKDSDDQKREIINLSENPLVTAQAFRAFLRVRLPITTK